jgi:hypothetical protein
MSETADLNDSTESLFTVFRGRLFQFRIVRGKNDCCLSCKRVGGIWYESECMFRENLNGGMSMSVFGIATSSCEILYNMTRRASDLRSARLRQFKCSIMLLTLEVL